MSSRATVGGLVAAAALLAVVATACHPPVPPDADFSPRWARTLSGPTNEDELDGVAVAPDGSVYVTGRRTPVRACRARRCRA